MVLVTGCDLDCGQDLFRLSQALRDRGVSHFSVAVWSSADMTQMNLPVFDVLQPFQPTPRLDRDKHAIHALWRRLSQYLSPGGAQMDQSLPAGGAGSGKLFAFIMFRRSRSLGDSPSRTLSRPSPDARGACSKWSTSSVRSSTTGTKIKMGRQPRSGDSPWLSAHSILNWIGGDITS